MHRLYLQKYKPDNILLQEEGKPAKLQISYHFYSDHFNQNFNYSFAHPRSDTCKVCDSLDTKLKYVTGEDEKKQIMSEKAVHLTKAEIFYKEISEKVKLAKAQSNVETIDFDYQQNLPLPVVPLGDVFYMRQLWVFSFCIFEASTGKSYFFLYDESMSRKGQNEVTSMLHYYFDNILTNDVTNVYLFSDNCSAQNKNNLLIQFLYILVNTQIFQFIIHRYPEPGHSFLPCNRSFALVEKEKRKRERVYLPSDCVIL